MVPERSDELHPSPRRGGGRASRRDGWGGGQYGSNVSREGHAPTPTTLRVVGPPREGEV
jgi:hypothetical protein